MSDAQKPEAVGLDQFASWDPLAWLTREMWHGLEWHFLNAANMATLDAAIAASGSPRSAETK